MNIRRDQASRELLSKQLPISDVIAARQNGNNQVIYKFPLGWSIVASKSGVSFAGASSNFNYEQLPTVQRFIRWAARIHQELKRDRGIVPQGEIEGHLKLRARQIETGLYTAWYEGYNSKRVEGSSMNAAIRDLREMWRDLDR